MSEAAPEPSPEQSPPAGAPVEPAAPEVPVTTSIQAEAQSTTGIDDTSGVIRNESPVVTQAPRSSGFPWGFLFMVLIIAGIVGFMIWAARRQRKRIEKMCSGITDWAQKILCMQSMGAGNYRGYRGTRGRGGINIEL